jgi:hypothetical protein
MDRLYSIALNVKNYEEKFTGKKFYIILIGLGLFSLGLALISLMLDAYGYGGNYCWIKNRNSDTATNGLRYGSFYSIVWTTMILIVVLHCYRYNKLGIATSEEGRRAFKIIRWYPAVTFICYVPVSISRIAQTCDPNLTKKDDTFAAYYILSSQIVRLLGFFNSIVYVFSDGAVEDLEANWDACWKFISSCCKKSRQQANPRYKESADITALEA